VLLFMIINRSVDFSRKEIIPSQVVAIKIFFSGYTWVAAMNFPVAPWL
jgi:hypothetical protein